jgi:hypothetical protein
MRGKCLEWIRFQPSREISGATNTDWESGLLSDLSPREDVNGFKPSVVNVDHGEGRWGRELAGVSFAFGLELESVPVVVNERWTSRAVGISDSSPLYTSSSNDESVSEILTKKKRRIN